MKCTYVAEENTKSSHHVLAAFNDFHNFICKINQVQLFHKCRNTAFFDLCHFAYSFSLCVCSPSFPHSFLSSPILAVVLLHHQCQPHKHIHTSGSELFEEIDFSAPHVMPERLPSL